MFDLGMFLCCDARPMSRCCDWCFPQRQLKKLGALFGNGLFPWCFFCRSVTLARFHLTPNGSCRTVIAPLLIDLPYALIRAAAEVGIPVI